MQLITEDNGEKKHNMSWDSSILTKRHYGEDHSWSKALVEEYKKRRRLNDNIGIQRALIRLEEEEENAIQDMAA